MKRPTFLPLLSAIFLLVGLVASKAAQSIVDVFGPDAANGTSVAQFISSASGFNSPKVHPVNSTSFDWWYFDAVSEDQQYSIVVIFFISSYRAFPFISGSTILPTIITISSSEDDLLTGAEAFAEEATIVTTGDGATGLWKDTGFSFAGTEDMSSYTISVNASGIQGTFTMDTISPPHYPCALAGANESMLLMPHIGWANSIPDSIGKVDFNVNGTDVNFTGVGYHDKNWADKPMNDTVASWYWGHGRLGPYTVVWFDALSLNNAAEYASGYVTQNSSVLTNGCLAASVRPLGSNTSYPPTASNDLPTGFNVSISLDSGDTLVFQVELVSVIAGGTGIYSRWVAALTGGLVGGSGESWNGTAVTEQFVFDD
ncbi:MAG: hypothetical protein M1834_007058 [Cirrosporium novae-zelandiae]|nr:MAG: hypothetical protein M1834_007058 [Cirrosporium novae-zelandiae]